MNRFQKPKRTTAFVSRILLPVVVFLCAILMLQKGVSSLSDTAENTRLESLKLALSRSVVHCYAVEGRYPESLDDLKEHYGITWDTDKYVVDYELTGANLMPSIHVISLQP